MNLEEDRLKNDLNDLQAHIIKNFPSLSEILVLKKPSDSTTELDINFFEKKMNEEIFEKNQELLEFL